MKHIVSVFQIYPQVVNREAQNIDDTDSTQDSSPVKKELPPIIAHKSSSVFHSRPPTKSGGRNLQDSTFSLSGGKTVLV